MAKRREFDPATLCFAQQLAFLAGPGKRKVVCCSRRAGKTMGIAVGLLDRVTQPPYTNVFYVTLTLKNAKRIVWSAVKALNEKYQLGGVPNESEGYLKFPKLGDDVHLYLGGVKDPREADKLRGPPAKLYVLDEAQGLSQRVIGPLLKDVIQPGLLDYGGELWVSGTPGALRSGYFFDIYEGAKRGSWERHHWTWRENGMLPRRLMGVSVAEMEAELQDELKMAPDDPTYLREWHGQWVDDLNALVLHYDQQRNPCEWQLGPQKGWTYVVGFDIGFNDADAIAVLGWKTGSKQLHLVAELIKPKQDVLDLADDVAHMVELWKPIKVVGDLGALGKKIGATIRKHRHIAVIAADKLRKAEHIAMLNAAMRRQEFMAPLDSRFVDDAAHLQWDMSARARNGKHVISSEYHSDIADAVLYAATECYAYTEKAIPPPLTPVQQVDEWERLEAEKQAAGRSQAWWDQA